MSAAVSGYRRFWMPPFLDAACCGCYQFWMPPTVDVTNFGFRQLWMPLFGSPSINAANSEELDNNPRCFHIKPS